MLGSFKKELLILVVSFQIFQHLNLDSIWVQRSSTNYMVHEIPLTSSNHSDPTCLKRKPSNICNMQLFWSDGNQSDGDRPARKDILCAMRAITVASITIKQDQTISKKAEVHGLIVKTSYGDPRIIVVISYDSIFCMISMSEWRSHVKLEDYLLVTAR